MLLIFSLTLFLSATLLFIVEPMFAKMILPLLGGTPAVWNTCLVFYQGALLAGYVYAHAATKWLGVRRSAAFHLALLALIILTLPIGVAHGWTPPATANPIPWLFMILLLSVGLPFFVISTTAPLLQKWFAHTGHSAARDPYFLYGASNLGSMLALLGYPVLVEPFLRLKLQAWAWAGGYLVLMGLIGVCAVMLWRSPAVAVPAREAEAGAAPGAPETIPPGRRVWWVLLSFAPSSLLLGVTSYLSTDLAAVPLLWVIPLAIYLLTFVLVFARQPLLSHELMVRLEAVFVVPIGILYFLGLKTGIWVLFPMHLLTFFLIAMVCHGELMRYRPGAAHLTEFYLWMSVGGVLGGLFNALVAPAVFTSVIEYPLIIMVACLLRPAAPSPGARPWSRGLDYVLPVALVAALAAAAKMLPAGPGPFKLGAVVALAMGAALLVFSFRERPHRFGLALGALMLAGVFLPLDLGASLFKERNFFGVLQVQHDVRGRHHLLYHGTTLHGAQSLEPARRREPLTYYHPSGPLGQVLAAAFQDPGKRQVAVIGLGTGSIAGYGRPGQTFSFFEIDPAVEAIARDPRYFTYLSDCPAAVKVVLGDARLSLKNAPDSGYDIMVLDAFSSDAIPMHLITREALSLYLAKLREDGILAFHISNRFLDLKPVLGNLARDAGLTCLVREDRNLSDAEKKARKSPSIWAVMARRSEDLVKLAGNPGWQPVPGRAGEALWTDDFSNILTVFKWRSFELDEPVAALFSQ